MSNSKKKLPANKDELDVKNQASKIISKNHSIGHRQRLKEKLLKDKHAMPDYEKLELLLTYVIPRKDTKPLAKELLHRFGTIRGCFCAKKSELESVPGVGESVITFFTLQHEIISAYLNSQYQEKMTVRDLKEFATFAYSKLVTSEKEEFWIAYLDSQNRLIQFEALVLGTLTNISIESRDLVELALKKKASGLILCHNHPGGNQNVSKYDLETTHKLKELLEMLGVRLIEHLIITEKGCTLILAQSFINV